MKKKKKQARKEDKAVEEIVLLKNSLARALADYDNLEKRTVRQREELGVIIRSQFVSQLLPSFDMIYDAQGHLGDQGLVIAIQTLESTLKELGIEKVLSGPGTQFDQDVHEAVETEEHSDKKEGEILEELLGGWKFTEGPLIRAAKVKVNKKNNN